MAKTLLVCNPTSSIAGGVQTWLRELCVGLDESRWRPLVALLRGTRAHDAAAYRTAWPELETVEIDGRGLAAGGRIRAVERCLKRVRPDVFVPLLAVDAHYAACAAKAAGMGVRYLLHVPGNMPPQIADARQHAPWADLAVGPGRLNCGLLEWAGMPRDRVRHVPYGAAVPKRPRRVRGPGEPLRLAYVGRLAAADKRVGDLVPLVAALVSRGVSYQLTIAGDGAQLASLKNALGEFERVRFLGTLNTGALYEHVYPELDVLLLFSESESFGIAVVEAMLHGVVPVTSRFVGLGAEGMLRHGETALLFPVGDAVAAASCVERLATSPELLGQLSHRARAAVEGRYTWPGCVSGWTAALDEVIELPARSGAQLPEVTPTRTSGRLDRLGVPAGLKEWVRGVRTRVIGVPEALKGGEEWPWIGTGHSADHLAEIAQVARRLDRWSA
jgi:glycosyltransferase involved in cell wall biosynthesis